MTPIAAPAGPIPAARPGGEDSDLIRALETMKPISPQANVDATSRCPKFEIRLQRANGRRGFIYDQLEPGRAKSFLAEHEFYIGLKYSTLFWIRPQRPEKPIPPQ